MTHALNDQPLSAPLPGAREGAKPAQTSQAPGSIDFLALTAAEPSSRADPYPAIEAARVKGDVLRDPANGCWVALSHPAVREAASERLHWKDPDRACPEARAIRRRREQPPEGLDAPFDRFNSMLDLDPPEHGRVRDPLVRALNARVMRDFDRIRSVVEGVVDAIGGETELDLVERVANASPVAVMALLLGVPDAMAGRFREWIAALSLTFTPDRSLQQQARLRDASNDIGPFLQSALEQRRQAPGEDLISDFARVQTEGAPVSDREISYNIRAILIAGQMTTTDLIASAAWLILTHPSARGLLAARPELWAAAVEEALRLESPVDYTWRIAHRDIELAGRQVRAGEPINCFLRAANRDPEMFTEPGRFEITRRGNRHLAFGAGAHACPGAPLARLQARLLLERLFGSYPNLRLADPGAAPEWRTTPGFRGLARLPVRLDAPVG